MRQRRIGSILLSASLVLGLLAGCQGGGSESTAPSAPPVSDAVSEAVPSDPAPELSESLQAVYDLGIADLDVLSRPEDACTQEETADMLSRVLKLRRGVESKYLADPGVVTEGVETTRHYFAQAMYFSLMETFFDDPYEDWEQWIGVCLENDQLQFDGVMLATQPDTQLIGRKLDGTVGEGGLWEFYPDHTEDEIPPDEETSRYYIDFGYSPALNYAVLLYDRTTGRRVLEPDEEGNIRPFGVMTVEETAQAALRYYNSFEDAPEMVPYEDVAAFDSSIITPELLEKESSLPDASCAELPAEWRGAMVSDLGLVTFQTLDGKPDKCVFEYEIQSLKDAGLNFAAINVDFSLLQGPIPEEGMLNESRLKQLDQIIAWCIERDLHVDLRCSGVGGLEVNDRLDEWFAWNHEKCNGTDYAPEFAALWKALAQRYAGIDNRYLSFNLLMEPEISSDEQYAAFFGPAVEAIREVTPDRCIIADIHCPGLTGVSMAEMGVALSYHEYSPREFCVIESEVQDDAGYLQSVTWPYTASNGVTYDAQAVLDDPIADSVSANELAAIAEEYGVGFMIGEFGVFVGDGSHGMPTNRYSDETLSAYFRDMASVMEEKGYGWCLGVWDGVYGPVSYCPAVTDAEYEQVDDHAYYIDRFLFDLIREISGAA